MRFDELIRPGMTIREVKTTYPSTLEVFDSLNFRESCDDCSIEAVCRKYGLISQEVVQRLNKAIVKEA